MTEPPQNHTGDERLDQVCAGLERAQGLKDSPVSPSILASTLLNYLGQPQPTRNFSIERALQTDPGLQQLAQDYLKRNALARLGRRRAADEGMDAASGERRQSGLCLKWRTSRADAQQFYLILELSAPLAVSDGEPYSLYLQSTESGLHRLDFPALQNGCSQLIRSHDDPAVIALRHNDTQLSLISYRS
ncbi:hypothetical protein A9Q89_03705 [Gammaproteobacteria bacterium 53_120_T64]|nr:hypothetical protein A9Q89_03705 [Gammaproteobacteria bacterium 53_120_T64]